MFDTYSDKLNQFPENVIVLLGESLLNVTDGKDITLEEINIALEVISIFFKPISKIFDALIFIYKVRFINRLRKF